MPNFERRRLMGDPGNYRFVCDLTPLPSAAIGRGAFDRHGRLREALIRAARGYAASGQSGRTQYLAEIHD